MLALSQAVSTFPLGSSSYWVDNYLVSSKWKLFVEK